MTAPNLKDIKEVERISSMIFVCKGLSKICELLASYSASKDKKLKGDFERFAKTYDFMAKTYAKGLVSEISKSRTKRPGRKKK